MKVKIGNYNNWFGPYQFADLLRFLGVQKETRHKIAEWIPVGPFNWFHSLKKRNIKVHIDDYDIWSMDHTLALIIVPMLKMLKERKVGIPSSIFEREDEPFDDAEKRWDEILDKMIWSFEQDINIGDWDDQFYKDGNFDREGYLAHVEKIKEGHKLFGEYYNSLWD